jgi:bacillithiol system protein YtxJ
MKELTSLDAWEAAFAASDEKPIFLFKHSTRCPISAGAHDRVVSFLAHAPQGRPEFYLIKVIESRPVSNAIAETLGVPHQSPQLILLKGRKAVWFSSHYGITEDSVTDAIKEHC